MVAVADELLGVVNGVRVELAETVEPWGLGADALAIPVGNVLGALGTSVATAFTHARLALGRVDLPAIHSSAPIVIGPSEPPYGDVRFLVLLSPHDPADGEVDAGSIATATRAAVLAAAEAGATGLALPLPGTGALRIAGGTAATAALPALVAALRSTGVEALRRVVLFDRPDATAAVIRQVWRDRVDVGPRLTGGVARDLVRATEAIPLHRDRLGVAPYVSMLAEAITAENTETPLSVGVFGNWGSGKSFFMGVLRGRVAELAGTPDHCGRVEQIGFNAWHYADTDLWASLGDVIFRALAGPDPAPSAKQAAVRESLADASRRRAELAEVTARAEREVARLTASVDEARGRHVARARDVLAALRTSDKLADHTARMWAGLGVDDESEQAKLLSDELRGHREDAAALRRTAASRNGRIALVVAGVVLALALVLALVLPAVAASVGVLAVLVGGWGAQAVERARKGVGLLRSLGEDLRAGLDQPAPVAAAMAELRKAEADRLIAQAQLDEVVAEVGELGRRLSDLDPARRARAFLADRAAGDTYTRHLGAVSALRKDFERLVALLEDWRASDDPEAIHRIVLHIDDLDRCGPRQVVQVLEAVHLLLAVDLFVVVIAVDPRWLVRALRSHYSDILAQSPGEWRVTPEDYLEKIINIPFTLPGMPGDQLRAMLDDHVPPRRQNPDRPWGPAGTAPVAAMTIEPGAPLDLAVPPEPRQPLTDPELDLIAALAPLIPTPRAAKRLVNIYRMIRATRDLGPAARFLGGEDEPGEFQAVVVLLGIVAAAPSLAAAVLSAPELDAATPGGLLARRPGETWPGFAADLRPSGGRSRIAGPVDDAEARRWAALHDGLRAVTERVALPDLGPFRAWAPRILRFSYLVDPNR